MKYTVLQELKDFLEAERDLGFLKEKSFDRIIWYINTYFIEKEKKQIIQAIDETQEKQVLMDLAIMSLSESGTKGEIYFNQKFTKVPIKD